MSLTLAMVGAGRVGRALGRRLHELGWRIGPVVTRAPQTARAAVRAIGAGSAFAGLTRRVLAADAVLIATPDRAIESVAARLARMGGAEWRGKVVLHTSGAYDSTVLRPLVRCGAAVGSLHPLQTFSGHAPPRLEGALFVVEGDAAARRLARRLVRQLGGAAILLRGRDKPAYHAAGAFASGHALAILEAATRILMALGFTRRQATRALLGLTRETLDNLERLGPQAAWTGPLSREDLGTVERHVRALRRFPRPYGAAYAALTRLAAAVLVLRPGSLERRLARILRGA